MNTCPVCGYQGTVENCPNDGARLLSAGQLAELEPPDPTQAPPLAPERRHATAMGVQNDDALRGDNYGKWAEPSLPKKRRDPMIGRVIGGRYEVQSLLGKGGMGAVYKAWQPAVQRLIALKVLLSEFAENETVIKRFHQEALAASRLKHPNTISVYDFGQTEDGILYISMEYLRGESLSQALSGGQIMSPKRAIHIMRQCCKSLSEAHSAGIIHRDIKPDNIFLTDVERDYVKVLDFGVAKLKEFEGKEGTLTQAGMIFGTPKYMSPEQARSGKLDPRSDVYALGVVLYEMLIGQPPFVSDNPLSILIAHVNEQPRPFIEIQPDHTIPAPLEAIVFKALQKNRENRQPDTDVLLNELDAVNEMLAGAPYESVKSRLPALPATPDHSAMGPAIVPSATDDTVHGGGGSDTVMLGGGDAALVPDHVIVDAVEPEPPKQQNVGLWILLGAIPVIGIGVWLALSTDTAEQQTKDTGVIAAVVDAGRPPVDAKLAQKTVTSPKHAGPAKAPEALSDGRFQIESKPVGAKIYDSAGQFIGKTPDVITVKTAGEYTLKLGRHKDYTFRLDPADKQLKKLFELKRKKRSGKPTPSKTTASGKPKDEDAPAKVIKTTKVKRPPATSVIKKKPKENFDPDLD